MEYTATYQIDGGVSHGFGITYPDYYKKTEKMQADNVFEAGVMAIKKMIYLSKTSLCNPETGFTKVSILELIDQNGKIIKTEQLEELAERFKLKVDLEDNQIMAKSYLIEHWLRYGKVA